MDARRRELGEFLQILRSRSRPEDFGFVNRTRRRTTGLRREEIAQLIGISPTWYTWIEQGRDVNVSAEVLDRLARRLKLTRSERAYLFDMADRRDPHMQGPEADDAPLILRQLLAHTDVPAYLMGRHWELLGWNAPATELFTGWLDCLSPDDGPPNMLRFVFLRPETRTFLIDWQTRAQRITAEFRADCATRLDEPALVTLIDQLHAASSEFATFWKQHDVLERQGGERGFLHPKRGLVHYQQVTLKPVEQEHLKFVFLRPKTD